MKVILKQNVAKVGSKYDILNVSDGYALNFLLPKGFAEVATQNKVDSLEGLKAKDVLEEKEKELVLEKELKKIEGKIVEVSSKANEKGKLFAGLKAEDVIESVNKEIGSNFSVEHLMQSETIKKTGEYELSMKVGSKEVKFTFKVNSEE